MNQLKINSVDDRSDSNSDDVLRPLKIEKRMNLKKTRLASTHALKDDIGDLKFVQIVVEFAKIGEIDTL